MAQILGARHGQDRLDQAGHVSWIVFEIRILNCNDLPLCEFEALVQGAALAIRSLTVLLGAGDEERDSGEKA